LLDHILTSSADFLIWEGADNHKKGIRGIPFDVFIAALLRSMMMIDYTTSVIAATRTKSNCCSRHFVFNNNVGHKGTIFIESVLRSWVFHCGICSRYGNPDPTQLSWHSALTTYRPIPLSLLLGWSSPCQCSLDIKSKTVPCQIWFRRFCIYGW
jgi:hypothetical protein